MRDSLVECLGSGDVSAGIAGNHHDDTGEFAEIVLRVAVEAETRDAVERFSRELMPLITAGSQGTTGYAEGRPRVHPVFRYWPCLIDRSKVVSHVEILECANSNSTAKHAQKPNAPTAPGSAGGSVTQPTHTPASLQRPTRLYDIAHARSGDKGTSANIGVIARTHDCWKFLQTWLTAERVAEFLAPLGIESIKRYELPNLGALNFVLRGVLKRGLRTDAQGKALGQILLEMPLPEDAVRRITVSE